MAVDSWYYKQADETCGPISFEDLFAMAHQGKLTPQTEIRNGETGNWFPADDIGGLFDADSEHVASDETPSLDEFSIVDSSFGVESKENLPSLDGFSIIEEEDKLSSELESQLPRFATLEAVRSKHQKIQWFCRILNQELGPMSADDLMQLLLDGELAPNDEVKSSAEPEWVPARTVVFLSSSGGDLDILDSEAEETASVVPASAEAVAEEPPVEPAPAEAPVEPAKPPILKVRSKQKWFCKLGGMGYGPIEAHKIKMWAEQERVEPTDLLKLGRKGEWFEAWQIEALQLKKPVDEKQEADEVAAAEDASETKPTTEPDKAAATAAPVAATPPPAQPAASPVAAAAPTPPRPKPKIKVARSNPLEALGPLMDPKILGGIAGVIVLAAILFFVPIGDLFTPGGREELAKFKAVHQEFLALQQKQASDAEWTSFEKKAQSDLAPVIAELETSASSDRPHLQHLLWAGRDYLEPMLENARTESNRDQEKFETHLKEAERIISE
ncbi:hypothetical protein Pan241w_57510 [Gimesia alba]|uniref:GYF domain-containing protein n=1 Tax=Gimesia alba TaxID=2527973 RepID=A0A517RP51_9PLAN|nr:DUF4339 domain-containing protein [Gimesia alba]QDT45625.1 hypothetical protein Pan241w_57510 [Gimesia alba]